MNVYFEYFRAHVAWSRKRRARYVGFRTYILAGISLIHPSNLSRKKGNCRSSWQTLSQSALRYFSEIRRWQYSLPHKRSEGRCSAILQSDTWGIGEAKLLDDSYHVVCNSFSLKSPPAVHWISSILHSCKRLKRGRVSAHIPAIEGHLRSTPEARTIRQIQMMVLPYSDGYYLLLPIYLLRYASEYWRLFLHEFGSVMISSDPHTNRERIIPYPTSTYLAAWGL